MATLVFDIETSALPLELFDEAQQEYLFRETEKIDDAIAKNAKREEITRFMSLWPFTSQVVCIAMLNAETQRGQTHLSSPRILRSDGRRRRAGGVHARARTRPNCSPQFWDVAKHYDSVVTFNGRGFDVPFIYLRSALLNVPISKKNWLGYRYATEPHCDLAEQLTFYSVSGRDGAARRFNLDFYCKAFGIESPKSHGVTGMDVNDADGREEIPRDRRILPARRARHGGALQNLEGKAGGDKIKTLTNLHVSPPNPSLENSLINQ